VSELTHRGRYCLCLGLNNDGGAVDGAWLSGDGDDDAKPGDVPACW